MFEASVKELEVGLKKLKDTSYDSIDRLMRRIMRKNGVTAKELHNAFKNKHNQTPDDWIKSIKKESIEMNLNKSSILESSKMRYCPKCEKNETREECAYGSKYWDKYSTPAKVEEAKDHEHSMIRSQLSTISNAASRIKKKMKGEGNVEAWVQSKLTKAADYIDSVADYIESGEHDVEESISFDIGPEHNKNKKREKIRKLAKRGATEGERQAASNKLGKTPELPNVRKEEKLVDKILDELLEKKDPCWKGYTQVGMKMKNGKEVPNCVPVKKGVKRAKGYRKESISIEDANGNTFAEVIDIIKPEPIKGFKSQVNEVSRLQAQTGNVMMITLTWRGKYYSLKMFFPQVKLPTRKEINLELQKVYPGCKVVHSSVSQLDPNQPLIQSTMNGGNLGKPGPNRNYVKPMGESVELEESTKIDKSKMKCNKPKAQAVGDSLTGKSHVVKACKNGEEKIIRFGQRGVKGSPKKKGESESYRQRRLKFKSRHAKNIKKGKMSAAYWANRVKW
jgi:hypothetical protein